MLNAHFYQKTLFLTQISKRSTPTDLHHPDLHLAQFFSLESLKTSSAYAKTSLGLKMEKFLQTNLLYLPLCIPTAFVPLCFAAMFTLFKIIQYLRQNKNWLLLSLQLNSLQTCKPCCRHHTLAQLSHQSHYYYNEDWVQFFFWVTVFVSLNPHIDLCCILCVFVLITIMFKVCVF